MARYSYYYNPVSGDIKKVTPKAKKAYDEHFREERWTKLLDNETTLPTLVAAITALSGTAFLTWVLSVIFGYVEEEGGSLTAEARTIWKNFVLGGGLALDLITKPLTGQGGEAIPNPPGITGPASVSITYNELWDYVQTKYLFKDYYRK
jgi:hypothetical protein